MKTLNTTVFLIFAFLNFLCLNSSAQTVYSNNYDSIYFGGSGVLISNYPPTSNGTAEGDVILYESVTVLDGDTIDCYIITKSVSSGVNISNIDKTAGSGSTGSIIEDRFFAPQITFPSGTASGPGGEVEFELHFIANGSFSYNNLTGEANGTPVILTDVRVNAYDIDGNANQYSHEHVQFRNFAFSEMDELTTVVATYNHTTGYTTFSSPTHLKNMDATDDRFRVVVNYDSLSVMDLHVLSGSTNYVFIDFGPGLAYSENPVDHYRVSGLLLDDGDGLQDSMVDGLGIALLDGQNVYVNLINSGDSVIRSEPVQAGGNFSFATVIAGLYTIQTSSEYTPIYSTGFSADLPEHWVNTGEIMGSGSGSDGTVDGSLSIIVPDSILAGARLAINKLPESFDASYSIADPLFEQFLTIGTTGTSGLEGFDYEDGLKGAGDLIAITELPAGDHLLYYNGTLIEYGEDGINPPSLSNPFYINTYALNLLEVQFMDLVLNTLSFRFATFDEAGFMDPSPALYELTWSIPVPLKLISFEAETISSGVLLKWSTSMEENTSHFQIERMNSTTGEVEIIGFVEAAGVSFDILNYSFPDLNLPSGEVRILYRLVTRDFDGHQEESNWVSVNLQNDLSIDFYPNPVQNTLTVDLDPTFASEQTIRILDMQGRVLNELSTTSDQVTVDMTGLKPGMYIITVGTNNNYKSEKFYVK